MKLAIQGHETRGKEVIQLLEMLGGKNIHGYVGTTNEYYAIDNNKICTIYISVAKIDNCVTFTLEDFEEKFPYKVGDKVTLDKYPGIITGMSWYCDDVIYYVKGAGFSKGVCSTDLQPYEEENMEERKYTDLRLDVDQDDKLATEVTIDGNKITPPENYLIGKITKVDNGMFVEFVKKQPQYPKDYEECCKVLDIDTQFCMKYLPHGTFSYKEKIIYNLQELIICRDAYWKLAGKQLGLDKPWEPDWDNLSTTREFIKIYKGCFIYSSRVLVFPTAEMRDAFYDNFKNLIEQCKELL